MTRNNVVETVPLAAGHGFNTWAIASSIALAVLLFYIGNTFPSIQQALRSAGYLGTFALGVLYVYSFTSYSAAALLFIMCKTQNVWMAGTIATAGAVLGDLVLFGLFRSAKRFTDDDRTRFQERYARWWRSVEARIPRSWQPFAVVALVLAFLVLPLPNEFADFLLARIRKVRTSAVLVISYVGNGIGLYGIAWLAKLAARGRV